MYIKLMHLPMVRYTNDKDELNNSRFNNKTEGFRIVDTFLLSESARNQTRIVTINSTIDQSFDFLNPTAANNMLTSLKFKGL